MTPMARIRAEETAVVYLYWAWSGQASVGRTRLLEALARLRDHPPFFELSCDQDAEAASWLAAECDRTDLSLHGGGHGTLLVSCFGSVIDWLDKVHLCEAGDLDRKLQQMLSR